MKRIEADGEWWKIRRSPSGPWYCLTCGAEMNDKPCPLPKCVENRLRARRAMGLDPTHQGKEQE